MIKCEVIKEFTLERFDELKNIQRKRIDSKGKLYVGDTFECDKNLAEYLTGKNEKGKVVVKVIETIPEEKPIIETKQEIKQEEVTEEVVKVIEIEPEIKILSQSPVEELEKAINVKAEITTTKPKKKKSSKK